MKKINLFHWLSSSIIATTIFFSQVFLIPAQTDANADLFQAIKRRSLSLVKKALTNGASINAQDEAGRTPLLAAIDSGNISVFNYIYQQSPDCQRVDQDGNSAAHYAAMSSSTAIFNKAIADNSGCFSFIRQNRQQETPLHLAIQKRKLAQIKKIAAAKYGLEAKNNQGMTPLMYAASQGLSQAYLKPLIDAGANTAVKDSEGRTLLHLAAWGNNPSLASLLLQGGADINLTDNNGQTALMIATEKNSAGLLKLFFKNPFNGKNQDRQGNNILHFLAKSKYYNYVPDAVKMGAEINQKNRAGLAPLHTAIAVNNLKAVSILLQNQADGNLADNNGVLPVAMSYNVQNYDLLKIFLENGAKADVRSEGGENLLIDVLLKPTMKWREYYAELLLKNGVNPNQKDAEGKTALVLAIEKDYTKIVKYLIDNKADVNLPSPDGKKPILIAVEKAYYWMLSDLLRGGANIETKNEKGETLLQIANENALKQMNQYRWKTFMDLIQAGANVNVETNAKKTLMLSHIEKGWIESVSAMFKKGGLLTGKDSDGRSALHLAAVSGNASVLNLVLANNPEINAIDNNGDTALILMVKNKKVSLVRLLLEKGSNINHINNNDDSSLSIAARQLNQEMVSLLIQKGADIKRVNNSGNSILMEAIKEILKPTKNNQQLISMLIKAGADINAQNTYGNTALTYAINRKNPDLVKMILDNGANANAKDKNGYTPLHKAIFAALYNRLKNEDLVQIIEYLLNGGADINARDSSGATPLILALRGGTGVDTTAVSQAVAMLLNYSANVFVKDNNGLDALYYSRQSAISDAQELISREIQTLQNPTRMVSLQSILQIPVSNDQPLDIRVSRSNHVYLLQKIDSGSRLTKYNNGRELWRKEFPFGSKIAPLDKEDAVYLLGTALGNINGKPDRYCKNNNNRIIYLAKLDGNGTEQWKIERSQVRACDKTEVIDLQVDSDSDEVVMGITFHKHSQNYIYRIKPTSEESWKKKIGWEWSQIQIGQDGMVYLLGPYIYKFLADGKDQKYVQLKNIKNINSQSIGQTSDIAYLANGAIDNQKSRGLWTAAFNEKGSPIWQHHFSSGKQDLPIMQFAGRGNQSYIIGTTNGSLHNNKNQGSTDIFVISLNSEGKRQGTILLGTPRADRPLLGFMGLNNTIYLLASNEQNWNILRLEMR